MPNKQILSHDRDRYLFYLVCVFHPRFSLHRRSRCFFLHRHGGHFFLHLTHDVWRFLLLRRKSLPCLRLRPRPLDLDLTHRNRGLADRGRYLIFSVSILASVDADADLRCLRLHHYPIREALASRVAALPSLVDQLSPLHRVQVQLLDYRPYVR